MTTEEMREESARLAALNVRPQSVRMLDEAADVLDWYRKRCEHAREQLMVAHESPAARVALAVSTLNGALQWSPIDPPRLTPGQPYARIDDGLVGNPDACKSKIDIQIEPGGETLTILIDENDPRGDDTGAGRAFAMFDINGRSPHTRRALIELANAIARDNRERPDNDQSQKTANYLPNTSVDTPGKGANP